MFKGPISEKNLQYECGNTGTYHGKLCQPKGVRIGVVQVTSQKFDMILSLHNATLNDAGVYTVRVKVASPDRSKEFSLTKTFQVHMICKSYACVCKSTGYRSCGQDHYSHVYQANLLI